MMSKNHFITFVVISTFVALFLSVCVITSASAQAILEFKKYKDQQKWPEAVRVIRDEICAPFISDESYLSDIRILGLAALANYAQ